MAITTLDGVIAGLQQPQALFKVGTTMEAIGTPHSHWYATGRPGAGAAPAPGVNGAALTSTVAGQISHTNPGAGNAYLARFAAQMSNPGTLLLCDRLWHNSGLSITSTSLQSITPAAIPARDLNGSTDGVGVMAALEFSVISGAGTPTVTLTYTDSEGTGSNTAAFVGATTSQVGTFYMWPLAAGDVGVRSVEGYQANATWTSGTIHIILYRILAALDCTAANIGNAIDAVTGGMPRIYDSSVPFLVQIPSAVTATNISGTYTETQG